MKHNDVYPVIDLFAGPGGLGEGFASLKHPQNPNHYAFRTAISIEKDESAHKTLQLRHFYRQFEPNNVPNDYYLYLEGEISLDELYKRHPEATAIAKQTAWLFELGEEPKKNVKEKIANAVGKHKKWVLVGGPPCQAYSLVGRARMMGNEDFEKDPRHFLYKEYLRIIADHTPPVFVMENVRGLLSAKINEEFVIQRILKDLTRPDLAIFNKDQKIKYNLYSLSQSGVMKLDSDPNAFVVKAEEYSIPQARHRIFIVGIRDDIDIKPRILEKSHKRITVKDVIGDLPKLRSGISRKTDSTNLWKETLNEVISQTWFLESKDKGDVKLTSLINRVITSLKKQTLEKSSAKYTTPKVLKEWFADDRLKTISSHESRSHMTSDLHRYLFSSAYAQVHKISPKLSDFPEDLLPNHKNVNEGVSGKKFADRFRVQIANAPATTITSHIAKDGHYYIHYDPKQCRSLTIREAARIQTFPDNYKFEGTRTSQYTQVGNAVPPLLANKIAEIVFEILEKISDD